MPIRVGHESSTGLEAPLSIPENPATMSPSRPKLACRRARHRKAQTYPGSFHTLPTRFSVFETNLSVLAYATQNLVGSLPRCVGFCRSSIAAVTLPCFSGSSPTWNVTLRFRFPLSPFTRPMIQMFSCLEILPSNPPAAWSRVRPAVWTWQAAPWTCGRFISSIPVQ